MNEKTNQDQTEAKPEGANAPELLPAVRCRSASPYITVAEWEEINKKEYPHYGPIWFYDDYGECWDKGFWMDHKESFDKERNNPPPTHAMWAIDFEPLVLDVNLPFPRNNGEIKFPTLQRNVHAE